MIETTLSLGSELLLLVLLAVAILPPLVGRIVKLFHGRRLPGRSRRGFVQICPGYRSLLRDLGLTEPEQFLALPAVTVSGHPDRNVSRVVLGEGEEALTGFLKREHVVPWRERLRNALAGFGWVSRSLRECRVLQALEREGVPCPDWLAAGEDGQGRAFLLLREQAGCIELRRQLQQLHQPEERRRLANLLGQTLARLHHQGFTHPDLYANHVLLQPGGASSSSAARLVLLDWQRTRRRKRVSWHQRGRDLSALHVTLPGELASPRERWRCLRSYLIESRRLAQYSDGTWPQQRLLHSPHCRVLLTGLEQGAQRRLRRRHVLEKRQQGLVLVAQTWRRLDGEALCLTNHLARTWPDCDPGWLALTETPHPQPLSPAGRGEKRNLPPFGKVLARRWLPLAGGKRVCLERRAAWSPLALLNFWTRRPRWSPPEDRRSVLLLRLERHGVLGPTVLAKGHALRATGWYDSFLLTEPAGDALRLDLWLRRKAGDRSDQAARQRRDVLHQAGALLARLHQACCYLTRDDADGLLAVQWSAGPHRVLLQNIDGIEPARTALPWRARRDHDWLRRWLIAAGCGREDLQPMDLGYRRQLTGWDGPLPKEASTCQV